MRRWGISSRAIRAGLLVENRVACRPPLARFEVAAISNSVARYASGLVENTEWPSKIDPAAFCRLAGRIVRSIEPHSEADPAGVLLHLLVCFGSAVGRGPFFIGGGKRHGVNLFAVMVGATAEGRKGTAFALCRRLFADADPTWEKKHIQHGLSSGEGLIAAVSDAFPGEDGVPNKGLLIFESEFGSPLRMLSRQGNILSPILRQCWDGDGVAVMTKKSPMRASDTHVSLLGHITREELKLYLSATDLFSGLANRILWVCVRRSKILPEETSMPKDEWKRLVADLRRALEFGKRVHEVKLSRKAKRLWARIYTSLSIIPDGIFGAAISRAEAQVRRMALIFCLLDSCSEVRTQHLKAAMAVWNYCRQSAHYIFAGRTKPTVEQIIVRHLKNAVGGMTRSELSAVFHNHQDSASMSAALRQLELQGLVKKKTRMTAGRPAECWLATQSATRLEAI